VVFGGFWWRKLKLIWLIYILTTQTKLSKQLKQNYRNNKMLATTTSETYLGSLYISNSDLSRVCKFMVFRDTDTVKQLIMENMGSENIRDLYAKIVDDPLIHRGMFAGYSADDYALLLQNLITIMRAHAKPFKNMQGSFALAHLTYMMQIRTASENTDIDKIVDHKILGEWLSKMVDAVASSVDGQIYVARESGFDGDEDHGGYYRVTRM